MKSTFGDLIAYRFFPTKYFLDRAHPNTRAKWLLFLGIEEMDNIGRVYEFWTQPEPTGNVFGTPSSSQRSETIINALEPHLNCQNSILEIGCNAGRNLNHLFHKGYKSLRGIEISGVAVKKLRDAYPILNDVVVDIGPVERILPSYVTNSYDIVFTMAVLEHIHPSQQKIFEEICRVANEHILAIEPKKGHASHRQHPWNIIREFESCGARLISTCSWGSLWPSPLTYENEWAEGFENYDALLFSV